MEIRHSKTEDLDRMMEIYAYARDFMAANGNPRQWYINKWPPKELLEEDIRQNRSYVCVEDGQIVATFYYIYGKDIDPTYLNIEDGAWSKEDAYGAVHRIAVQGPKGVGSFCLNWAYEKSGYLRIDTHPDNRIMQNLLLKLGFKQCGIIYVEEDNDPRYAFDR